MRVDKHNVEDIRRYYYRTYVKFNETGDHVWYITDVSSDMIYAKDDQGEEVGIDLDKGYEIEYVIPGKSVYQCGDFAARLIRIPAKQYYRGMHKENTSFGMFSEGGTWRATDLNFPMIQSFVNKPSYYTINQIMAEWKDGLYENKSSWALSPHFAVSKGGKISTASGSIIGSIDFATKRIKHSPLFHNELHDLNVFNYLSPIKAKKVKDAE